MARSSLVASRWSWSGVMGVSLAVWGGLVWLAWGVGFGGFSSFFGCERGKVWLAELRWSLGRRPELMRRGPLSAVVLPLAT